MTRFAKNKVFLASDVSRQHGDVGRDSHEDPLLLDNLYSSRGSYRLLTPGTLRRRYVHG